MKRLFRWYIDDEHTPMVLVMGLFFVMWYKEATIVIPRWRMGKHSPVTKYDYYAAVGAIRRSRAEEGRKEHAAC